MHEQIKKTRQTIIHNWQIEGKSKQIKSECNTGRSVSSSCCVVIQQWKSNAGNHQPTPWYGGECKSSGGIHYDSTAILLIVIESAITAVQQHVILTMCSSCHSFNALKHWKMIVCTIDPLQGTRNQTFETSASNTKQNQQKVHFDVARGLKQTQFTFWVNKDSPDSAQFNVLSLILFLLRQWHFHLSSWTL